VPPRASARYKQVNIGSQVVTGIVGPLDGSTLSGPPSSGETFTVSPKASMVSNFFVKDPLPLVLDADDCCIGHNENDYEIGIKAQELRRIYRRYNLVLVVN